MAVRSSKCSCSDGASIAVAIMVVALIMREEVELGYTAAARNGGSFSFHGGMLTSDESSFFVLAREIKAWLGMTREGRARPCTEGELAPRRHSHLSSNLHPFILLF